MMSADQDKITHENKTKMVIEFKKIYLESVKNGEI